MASCKFGFDSRSFRSRVTIVSSCVGWSARAGSATCPARGKVADVVTLCKHSCCGNRSAGGIEAALERLVTLRCPSLAHVGGKCMKDDRTAAGRNPGDRSQDEFQLSDPAKVTRRDVLIGGASTLVASQAFAAEQPGYLNVYYGDAARRSLVIAWVGDPPTCMPGGRVCEWRLHASTFAEGNGPSSGRFILQRTSSGWRVDLAGCSFPGGYKFKLTINALWDPKNPKPSLTFTMAIAGQDIVLKQDDLVGFLKSVPTKSPTQPDEIAGPVDKAQLSELAERLFGTTFEVGKARDVVLAFHHGGYWILRAGKKLGPVNVEPATDATNRFSALSGEGVALRFKEIAFSIFSGISGGAGEAFSIETDLAKEDVRALFSGDGAPPGLPDEVGNKATRVLYGLVRHSMAAPKAVKDDVWSGAIALGKAPAGETAVLELLDTVRARPAYLAWRNAGDGNPVFALHTPSKLAIRRTAHAAASKFENTSARS